MLIAITGIIGGGKSTVSDLLKENYPVLNTDAVNQELLETPQIQRIINQEVLNKNGEFNKEELAAAVFSKPHKMKKLESILHPLIKEEIDAWSSEFQQELAFVEVPVLYESGFESMFDYVVVVYASDQIVKERLMRDRGYSKEEVELRLAAQMPIEEKIKLADYVINNEGDYDKLKLEVKKLLKTLGVNNESAW